MATVASEPFVLCRGGRGGWGTATSPPPPSGSPLCQGRASPETRRDSGAEAPGRTWPERLSNCGQSSTLFVCGQQAQPKIATTTAHPLPQPEASSWVEEGSFRQGRHPPHHRGGQVMGAAWAIFLAHRRCRCGPTCGRVRQQGRDPAADFDAISQSSQRYSRSWATAPDSWPPTKTDILEDSSPFGSPPGPLEGLGLSLVEISRRPQGHPGAGEAGGGALSVLPPDRRVSRRYRAKAPSGRLHPWTVQHEERRLDVEAPGSKRSWPTSTCRLREPHVVDRTLRGGACPAGWRNGQSRMETPCP